MNRSNNAGFRTLVARMTLAGLVVGAVATDAAAEGSNELGVQYLENRTTAYVDILDPSVEGITWTGFGRITIADPTGATVAQLSTGETADLTGYASGAYEITFSASQEQEEGWDISVSNAVDGDGRLHSYAWYLNSGSYGEESEFNGSFFALVRAGGDGFTGVVEMQTDGLAGYQWQMAANSVGVDGPNGGRSVLDASNSYTPEYPVYLNPPSVASYTVKDPTVSSLRFTAGNNECSSVSPGYLSGMFRFESDVEGSYHIICDLNGDGIYDLSSDEDVALNGYADPGVNDVEWDGSDNSGAAVEDGSYACIVTVTVGEYHYIAADIETSYQGLRIFQVESDGSRAGLAMFWNDESIQDRDILMPSGEFGLSTSGADGLYAGNYNASTEANVNARSWGNYQEDGKGNAALLDTFVWLSASSSAEISVDVLDPDADADGNGIGDINELCDIEIELSGYYRGGLCSTGGRPAGGLLALGLGLVGAALRRRRS